MTPAGAGPTPLPASRPDGRTVQVGDDGVVRTSAPDGTTTICRPEGSTTVVHPDGTTEIFAPDGATVVTDGTGRRTTVSADGEVTTTASPPAYPGARTDTARERIPSPDPRVRQRISPIPVALAVGALALPVVIAVAVGLMAPPWPFDIVGSMLPVLVGVGLGAVLVLRGARMPGGPTVLRVFGLTALGLALVGAVTSLAVQASLVGPGPVLADIAAHAWVLAVVSLIAVPARTVGWLQLLGAAICGFFGVVAAARLVGVPVVAALGPGDLFATSVWVPLTEEVLKTVPILLALVLCARNRSQRLSVVDIGLIGVASGAGFALAENAQFGRSYASWTAVPGFSLLLPTIDPAGWDTILPVVAGHAVWTGLVGLGIGFAWFYRRRFRFAWTAAPAALLLVTVEHGLLNAGDVPSVLLVPVAGGLLSADLMLTGFAAMAVLERRRPMDRAAVLAGLGIAPPGPHRTALAARSNGVLR